MKKAIILLFCTLGIAGAGIFPSLGASILFPPDSDPVVYWHGGLGYAFPDNWDAQLGIGYAAWKSNGQDYSIMPLMGSGTYHLLSRESILDLYGGLGLGYAWRHWGDKGEQDAPCGELFVGSSLLLGKLFGIGISGGYLMDDLGHPDKGYTGVGLTLGIGVPF